MKLRIALLAAAVLAAAGPALAQAPRPGNRAPAALTRPAPAEDAQLAAVVAARSPADRERDAYRHPVEALTFWGLRPGMTVLEIGPGGGWWTQILAPYAQATGGRYIATVADPTDPAVGPEAGGRARMRFETAFADKARYGTIELVPIGPAKGLTIAPESADLILVARAFHNWAQEGITDKLMADFAAALKPGGTLAVEQHRSPEGAMKPETGYVPEKYVIAAAEKAGLKLDGRSELNANPRDDRDHPFGVWTLKPVRQSKSGDGTRPELTPAQRAEYDAIGESDRMTLRFRKPAA